MKRSRDIIRYTRHKYGLTVEEASSLAGVKRTQWQHFENRGRTVPKFFGSMCRTLDLDPVQLLKMEGIL